MNIAKVRARAGQDTYETEVYWCLKVLVLLAKAEGTEHHGELESARHQFITGHNNVMDYVDDIELYSPTQSRSIH